VMSSKPIGTIESTSTSPPSIRYRCPTVTCGRCHTRTVVVIAPDRTPSRRYFVKSTPQFSRARTDSGKVADRVTRTRRLRSISTAGVGHGRAVPNRVEVERARETSVFASGHGTRGRLSGFSLDRKQKIRPQANPPCRASGYALGETDRIVRPPLNLRNAGRLTDDQHLRFGVRPSGFASGSDLLLRFGVRPSAFASGSDLLASLRGQSLRAQTFRFLLGQKNEGLTPN
jgi:hypothetical protein